MANLVLGFAEVLVGAIILDAGIKGASIADVVKGQATAHPLATDSGSTGTGSAPAATTSATGAGTGSGSYTNPVPGAATGRIDQGVDYTLGAGGFVAPGRSQILIADAHNPGWKSGGYIAAKLLDGPMAGHVYYIAEGVIPAAGVAVGQIVNAGTQLVSRVSNPYNGSLGNIEAGWANPSSPGQPLAQAISGYAGDQSAQALTAGYSFSQFVQTLGGIAGQFQGAGTALAGSIERGFQPG